MKKVYLLLLLLIVVFQINAKTYYISTTGNNSKTGTLSAPFRTIQKGHDVAVAGDTIMVRGGLYERSPVFIKKSGSVGKPITYINYPGEVPIISGWTDYNNQTWELANLGNSDGFQSNDPNFVSYITIQGFHFTGWVWGAVGFNYNTKHDPWTQTDDDSNKGSNIIIRYCSADRCGVSGFSVMSSNTCIMEFNVVSNTGFTAPSWSSGLNMFSVGKDIVVRNNVSCDNVDISSANSDGNGIIIDISRGYSSAQIYNNICFNNGGGGIVITQSSNCQIYNNTCFGNGWDVMSAGDISIGWQDSFKGLMVKNNLVWATGNGGKVINQWPGNMFSSALVSNNNFTSLSAITDPKFVNVKAAVPDVNLLSTSTMIGTGTPIQGLTDDNGVDMRVLTTQTDAPFPKWKNKVDLAFIQSKGGLINCFAPKARTGNPDKGAVQYSATTGIQTPGRSDENARIKVYPNPVIDNSMTIELNGFAFSESTNLSIYDIQGRIVYKSQLAEGKKKLILNSENILKSGLYLVKAANTNGSLTQKLIVD